MSRVWGSAAGQRAALAGALVLAAVVVADLVTATGAGLISVLLLAPLVAAVASTPRGVAILAAVALAAALLLGAHDGIFGHTRHLIDVLAVGIGGVLAVLLVGGRNRLVGLRAIERAALDRISLLDRSSALIALPMDFRARLQALTELVVPDIADLCIVDLIGPDGEIQGAVVSAADDLDADALLRTRQRFPIDPHGEHPVAIALRSGEPQLRSAMRDEDLARYASSPEHLELMRRLRYSSAVVVPLKARGSMLGVLSVLRLGNPARFGEPEVSLMTDLASRAALAVDNARLYEEMRTAQARFEAIIANMAEAVTVQGPDGWMVYANQAAADLMGLASPEEVLALPPAQAWGDYVMFDEEGRPFDPEQFPGQRVLRGEQPEPTVVVHRHVPTGSERWTIVKATAVPHPFTGRTALAVNVIEDITEERRSQQASAFLSEASKVLASTLEFEETLERVAQAAVPAVADWCAVDLVEADGSIRPVAFAHADPYRVEFARRLRERYPIQPADPYGVPEVMRTGRSELHPAVDPAQIEAGAEDAEHLELLRALDITSVLIVPMTAHGKTLGTITFVTSGGRRRLNEADLALAEELGRRAGVAIDNARVHAQRSHVASTLQRSLLPPRLPVVPGVRIAARFRAAGEANQVGGDFYDLFPAGDAWVMAIGDVTGKGPGAAAITSLARYTIRTAAMYETDPAAIMRRLNEALLADGEHRQLCTAVCLRVTTGEEDEPVAVEVCCAGHPLPYLLRGRDDIETVCGPGPLLGAFEDAEWRSSRVALGAGEGLVLYTDGVTDARGEDGRFGHKRLERVLREAAGEGADEVAAQLDAALAAFEVGPQRDDVALLVLRAGEQSSIGEGSIVAAPAGARDQV